MLYKASLLFLAASAAFNALPAHGARTTKCRLKKRATQGFLELPSPDPTSPATNLPSSTSIQPTETPSEPESYEPLPPFDYSTRKMRGVNLGGWFMMEPWITPSMFDSTGNDAVVDEYTFGQLLDRDDALQRLKKHWETWYTEEDFALIKEYGLNHVRIPISYWSVPVEQDIGPFIPGAWPYILRALDWARKHELRVILDLHGAPGSQNGFDNSGQLTGSPQWAFNQAHIDQTVNVLRYLAETIADKVEVIQLLNEIAGFRDGFADAARAFWSAGYRAIREAAGNRVRVMMGDAFLTVGSWNGYLVEPEASSVIMDLHVYQIFSEPELQRSEEDHITQACSRIPEWVDYAAKNNWMVIGEWSLAKTDCTNYLNGRGIGARWDGTYSLGSGTVYGSCQGLTGKASTFSDEYKKFLRRYWEAQVTAAEAVQGWTYWTWKAENSDDWSYKAGVENGYIPKNPDDRLYPNICG